MPRAASLCLILLSLLILCTSAETIPNPSKRKGAGPLFQVVRRGKWGYMDRNGRIAIAPQFEYERDFFHGLAGVSLNKKWGFINEKGTVVIRAQFDEVRDFLDDLAPVRMGRKWGYIDTAGRMVVEPRFQAAAEFHEGLARVHIWERVGCTSGRFTKEDAPEYSFRLREDDHSDMPGCFPEGGHFGFVDKTGAVVIPANFFVAQDFSEGMAAVRVEETADSKYGYIDRTGRFTITPRFNYGGPFSEGLAAVETSARIVGDQVVDIAWGYADKTGGLAIPARYEFAGTFSEGLARVAIRAGRSMGYIDSSGKLVILPRFSEAWDFSDGIAAACASGCSYVDHSGKSIITAFHAWWPFVDGLAVVQDSDRHQVYIDKKGRVIARYDE